MVDQERFQATKPKQTSKETITHVDTSTKQRKEGNARLLKNKQEPTQVLTNTQMETPLGSRTPHIITAHNLRPPALPAPDLRRPIHPLLSPSPRANPARRARSFALPSRRLGGQKSKPTPAISQAFLSTSDGAQPR